MPNLCFTTMDIKGSVKQIEKIYKRLKNSNRSKSFDNINLNIDYQLLSCLDRLNIYITDDVGFNELNELCSLGIACNLDPENILYVHDIESVLHLAYSNLEKLSKDGSHHYWRGDGKEILQIFEYVCERLTQFKQDRYANDNLECGFGFSNIMPDNPISIYRDAKAFRINPVINEHVSEWYHSRLARLSTKWFPEISMCDITSPGELYLTMECAWGPCTNIAVYLTDIYDVSIDMQYSEGGMSFVGGEIIEDGQSSVYFEGSADTGLQFCRLEDDLFGGGESFYDNFINYVEYDIESDWGNVTRDELKEHLLDNENWLDAQEIDSLVDRFKPIRKIKVKRKR